MGLSYKNYGFLFIAAVVLLACNSEANESILEKINGEWSVEYYFRNGQDKTESMDNSIITIDTKNMLLTTNTLNMDQAMEEIPVIFKEKTIEKADGGENAHLFDFSFENDQLVLSRTMEYYGENWDLKWVLSETEASAE